MYMYRQPPSSQQCAPVSVPSETRKMMIIDISDDDDDEKVSGSRKCGDLIKTQCSSKNTRDEFKLHFSNIIISDDEDSYNDKAPNCTAKTQHTSRVSSDSDAQVTENTTLKYSTKLRKLASDNKQDKRKFDLNNNNIFVLSEDEEDTNVENIDEFRVHSSNVISAKRKRVANIITIDDEADKKQEKSSFDLYKTSSEDEEEDDGSESEGESLGGFIVDGSEESVADYDSESSNSGDEYEDVLNEYKVTMEKIGRKKISNYNWESEADMLSDFAKDPELCMSAVCVLWRQQTDDEKEFKVTKYQNERGFSQSDASRGSMLAEFLTDGDPNGDVTKTVEELLEYDPNGIKLCRKLAFKYSKQLFEIYQNKEDPFWPPQR